MSVRFPESNKNEIGSFKYAHSSLTNFFNQGKQVLYQLDDHRKQARYCF